MMGFPYFEKLPYNLTNMCRLWLKSRQLESEFQSTWYICAQLVGKRVGPDSGRQHLGASISEKSSITITMLAVRAPPCLQKVTIPANRCKNRTTFHHREKTNSTKGTNAVSLVAAGKKAS